MQILIKFVHLQYFIDFQSYKNNSFTYFLNVCHYKDILVKARDRMYFIKQFVSLSYNFKYLDIRYVGLHSLLMWEQGLIMFNVLATCIQWYIVLSSEIYETETGKIKTAIPTWKPINQPTDRPTNQPTTQRHRTDINRKQPLILFLPIHTMNFTS